MREIEVVAGTAVSPVQMLRALRDQPGLVALFGDWDGGDDLIGFRPVHVLAPGEDPFAALDTVPPAAAPGTAPPPTTPDAVPPLADPDGTPPCAAPDAAPPCAAPDAAPPCAASDTAPPGPAGATADGPGAAAAGPGWIGYLGYQLSRRLERLPAPPPRPARLPEHHLGFYDHVLRRRAGRGDWVLERWPGADPARTAAARGIVRDALAGPSGPEAYRCGPFRADASAAEHAAAVTAALGHIRDGDIFQANICRGLEASFEGDALDLFCAGHERLAPRFAAFLRLPGGAVASLSPELFLRRTGRAVLSSPIKGTAPAVTDPAELHASAKNRAENVMIVDLMRNDLSRACVPGSVRAPAAPRVEPHTGVHHLVADVRGLLRPGLGDGDLLRATFPPGSCTGAPKIRAMEIINALEPAGREVYTGAVGCAGPGGLVLNVAIRTFEFTGNRVRLGVGGGIVADSDPADEAHETLVKAVPLLDAVEAELDTPLRQDWDSHDGPAPAAPPAPDVPSPVSTSAVPTSTALPVLPGPLFELPARVPLRAEGVFTTLLVEEGEPAQLDAHLRRLGASCLACCGTALPRGVREEVLEHAAALPGPHRLRITAAPTPEGALDVRVTATALPPGPVPPWRLVPVRLPGGLGGHKWADRRALAHEPEPGLWSRSCDPLLVDTDGTVLETGRANLFAVLDDTVVTPPADGRILPGVVRARALEALRRSGRPVDERPLRLEELAAATEVFVTNSVAGAHPVGSVDGLARWQPGPVVHSLGSLTAR
ncbi:bifunctional aminodeoxychorismate synthase component I/aminodeoxychorismate lyase [Kocuria sediminis]|uniref:Bifunctional aminodeoxychorismate synthase component I/aminodeoxychorismate lyase n=1 Tax=Kocuria sediminis TaxID=1038857 RepID=A0A6N8GMB9_9MICC|nr:bifunctional chorismate-binding protein/class IV aminotransferase [Kocuria sediminis]MUN64266.1 bifunctional aminodeoxychorismate synthase component I/aminodeoxychorismate lyase [Kocuria sediminis]